MHDVLWGKRKLAEGGGGVVLKMVLRNGSQKCFSETVLKMFLENGSLKWFSERANGCAAAPVTATATHKKGQAGPLKHSSSMK